MTKGVRDYALVTGAYWGFTLTDRRAQDAGLAAF